MKYAESTLGDVCVLITDGSHNSPPSVEVDGLPMASVKDMTHWGINLQTCRRISQEDFATLVRQGCKPEIGDVLIAKDGATALDTVCEVRSDQNLVLLSSVAILRPDTKQVLTPYLRYFLESPRTKAYMKGALVTGAAIPRVVLKDFKRCPILLPNLDTQRRVASILSAYDDLIENNTRRIQVLKAIAKTVFDGASQALPESWALVSISDLYEGLYDGPHATPKPSTSGSIYLGIKNVTEQGELDLTDIRHIAEEDFAQWTRRVVPRQGDIVFTYEASLNRYGIIGRNFRGCLGRRMALIRPDERKIDSHLLLHCLLSDQWRDEVRSKVISGVTVDRIPLTTFPTFQIRVPDPDVRAKITPPIRACEELAENCRRRNDVLRKTRDLLLPKLVSGEVSVEQIEKDVVAQMV